MKVIKVVNFIKLWKLWKLQKFIKVYKSCDSYECQSPKKLDEWMFPFFET